jgi:hypothetical protein
MSKVHIKKNVHMHKPVHNNSNVCDLLPNLHHSGSSLLLLLLLLLLYVQFKIQVVLYRSVDVYTNSRERERGSSFYQAVYLSALSGPGGDVTLVKYSSLFLL